MNIKQIRITNISIALGHWNTTQTASTQIISIVWLKIWASYIWVSDCLSQFMLWMRAIFSIIDGSHWWQELPLLSTLIQSLCWECFCWSWDSRLRHQLWCPLGHVVGQLNAPYWLTWTQNARFNFQSAIWLCI